MKNYIYILIGGLMLTATSCKKIPGFKTDGLLY